MKISCPNCAKTYTLADGAIGPAGRSVRCSRCATTWLAQAPAETAPEESLDDAWETASAELAASGATDTGVGADAATTDDWFRPPAPDEDAPAAPEPLDAALGAGPVIDAVPGGFGDDDAARSRQAAKPRPKGPARKVGGKAKRRPAGLRVEIPPVFASLLAAAGFAAFITGAVMLREPIVRLVPDLASLYGFVGLEVNLRGLAIRDLKTFGEVDASGPVLVVEGQIVNVTAAAREVPMLRFGLKSEQHREIFAWSMEPAQPTLAPGETSRFRSRLPLPPDAASEIEVRFADRRATATRIP
ncbi:zinc-ribbon domain-containing protein [Methylobrevis albus]|uniref:Zinc-ribbon domain-containing protein n=1 Tax=Methylobrevis albus TaxID=2793297 RepID=A0A931I1H0_9HYPH|nr:zinc-ribbon domain-containing protein [Methylobrevis albus]MBH0237208.1 zinc-ribbon domain-containing protein [Methylobrevis albus]